MPCGVGGGTHWSTRPPGQLRWVPPKRFFFLYVLETTKIRHTLRNLLRLPPTPPPEPKPLDPPRALAPPSQDPQTARGKPRVPKRGKSREGLAWQFHRRGQGLGGESKGFGSGRVGVLFFESWRVDLVTCSRRGLPRAVWGLGKGWLGGARARGGPRASVPGGVGGRGTGPRDGANFATSYFCPNKKKKNGVF